VYLYHYIITAYHKTLHSCNPEELIKIETILSLFYPCDASYSVGITRRRVSLCVCPASIAWVKTIKYPVHGILLS